LVNKYNQFLKLASRNGEENINDGPN